MKSNASENLQWEWVIKPVVILGTLHRESSGRLSLSCSNTGIFCFVTEAQARLLGSASRHSASPYPSSLWTKSEFLSLTVAYKTLICKRFGNLEKRDQKHLKPNSLTFRSQDPFTVLKIIEDFKSLCWTVFIILIVLKLKTKF